MAQDRAYQAEGINELSRTFAAGHKSVLYQLPTGGGKTHVAANVIKRAALRGKRTMFLAHRKELIRQASRKLTDTGVEHGIIAPGFTPSRKACQVASVQTLAGRLEDPFYLPPDLLILDECIRGDALVETDIGPVPIKDIPKSGARFALSWNGHGFTWQKISAWWSSGIRETVRVSFSNGESLVCTPDHRFSVDKDWVCARDLLIGMKLVNSADYAPAGAAAKYSTVGVVGSPLLCVDTTQRVHARTGLKNTDNTWRRRRSAAAGAANALSQSLTPPPIFRTYTEALADIRNTCGTIIGGLKAHLIGFPTLSVDACWEAFSAMAQSAFPTQKHIITGRVGLTVQTKGIGSLTKHQCFLPQGPSSPKHQTRDMATSLSVSEPHACPASPMWQISSLLTGTSASRANGSTKSGMRDLLGGIAMTVRSALGVPRSSTPKVFPSQKSEPYKIGSRTSSEAARSTTMAAAISSSACTSTPVIECFDASNHSSHNPCVTNSLCVTGVAVCSAAEVFDITVDGSHCFFANGALVHNCHHASAGQWQKILAAYPKAWVLGITATPCRLDGRGLGVQAGGPFETMVCGPSIRDLMDQGYLVPARVFAPEDGAPDLSGVETRAGDFAPGALSDAMDKPALVGNCVSHYARLTPGLPGVAFCVSVQHAEHTAEQFRAAGWRAVAVSGNTDPDKRDAAIAGLATGEVQVLCSCDLISEGLDVPAIAVTMLLRPTKSLSLYLQQVGRGLRPSKGKDVLTVLDHAGNVSRFGMPSDDQEWSLAGRAKRNSAAISIKTCPSCFAVHSGGVSACPSCGHSYVAEQAKARELEVIEGELREIDAARIDRIRKARLHELLTGQETLDELKAIAKLRGYHHRWANHQMADRKQNQGAMA